MDDREVLPVNGHKEEATLTTTYNQDNEKRKSVYGVLEKICHNAVFCHVTGLTCFLSVMGLISTGLYLTMAGSNDSMMQEIGFLCLVSGSVVSIAPMLYACWAASGFHRISHMDKARRFSYCNDGIDDPEAPLPQYTGSVDSVNFNRATFKTFKKNDVFRQMVQNTSYKTALLDNHNKRQPTRFGVIETMRAGKVIRQTSYRLYDKLGADSLRSSFSNWNEYLSHTEYDTDLERIHSGKSTVSNGYGSKYDVSISKDSHTTLDILPINNRKLVKDEGEINTTAPGAVNPEVTVLTTLNREVIISKPIDSRERYEVLQQQYETFQNKYEQLLRNTLNTKASDTVISDLANQYFEKDKLNNTSENQQSDIWKPNSSKFADDIFRNGNATYNKLSKIKSEEAKSYQSLKCSITNLSSVAEAIVDYSSLWSVSLHKASHAHYDVQRDSIYPTPESKDDQTDILNPPATPGRPDESKNPPVRTLVSLFEMTIARRKILENYSRARQRSKEDPTSAGSSVSIKRARSRMSIRQDLDEQDGIQSSVSGFRNSSLCIPTPLPLRNADNTAEHSTATFSTDQSIITGKTKH